MIFNLLKATRCRVDVSFRQPNYWQVNIDLLKDLGVTDFLIERLENLPTQEFLVVEVYSESQIIAVVTAAFDNTSERVHARFCSFKPASSEAISVRLAMRMVEAQAVKVHEVYSLNNLLQGNSFRQFEEQ